MVVEWTYNEETCTLEGAEWCRCESRKSLWWLRPMTSRTGVCAIWLAWDMECVWSMVGLWLCCSESWLALLLTIYWPLSTGHCAQYLLWHSFYFYFYFEHLNCTQSYLIDMKISWSLDHIDLISTIYDLILISWSYHQMMIQDMFLYIKFTLLLTCIRHAFDSCLSLMIDMHSTHVAVQHAFTICFTCVCLEDNTWTLVYNRS